MALLADEWLEGLAAARPRPSRPSTPGNLFDDLGGAEPRTAESSTATPRTAPPSTAPPHSEAASGALSREARQLVEAVTALHAQAPTELPGPQALAETAVLLEQAERLRVVILGRLADVDVRRLAPLDDAPSTPSWVARQHSSVDRGEVTLARRLGRTPLVAEALIASAVTVGQARKVAAAMATVRRHLDRPDGLVDGVDGEAVVHAVVVDGVRQVVCEALGGLSDDDDRLAALQVTLDEIAARPTTQAARIEAAFLVVATQVDAGVLTSALGRLLDAVLPLALEERSDNAHADRGLTLVRKPGGGWRITEGDLDDECGELLHTVLTAEQAVDPDGPADTAGFDDLRRQGWQSGDPLPAEDGRGSQDDAGPRSLRQQRHDALRNGLRGYLASGVLGMRDKVAPHVSVTLGVELLERRPGAMPAVAASGAVLPTRLVLRWACDSTLTRFVLGLGRKVLEASHGQRTLTALERRAKRLETGGRCQGAGCHRGGPGVALVPHHATPFSRRGTTSLADTVLLCEQTHHQLHTGRTVRLRDGRRLGPDGWLDDRPP